MTLPPWTDSIDDTLGKELADSAGCLFRWALEGADLSSARPFETRGARLRSLLSILEGVAANEAANLWRRAAALGGLVALCDERGLGVDARPACRRALGSRAATDGVAGAVDAAQTTAWCVEADPLTRAQRHRRQIEAEATAWQRVRALPLARQLAAQDELIAEHAERGGPLEALSAAVDHVAAWLGATGRDSAASFIMLSVHGSPEELLPFLVDAVDRARGEARDAADAAHPCDPTAPPPNAYAQRKALKALASAEPGAWVFGLHRQRVADLRALRWSIEKNPDGKGDRLSEAHHRLARTLAL